MSRTHCHFEYFSASSIRTRVVSSRWVAGNLNASNLPPAAMQGMDLVYHRLRRLVAYQPDDKIPPLQPCGDTRQTAFLNSPA